MLAAGLLPSFLACAGKRAGRSHYAKKEEGYAVTPASYQRISFWPPEACLRKGRIRRFRREKGKTASQDAGLPEMESTSVTGREEKRADYPSQKGGKEEGAKGLATLMSGRPAFELGREKGAGGGEGEKRKKGLQPCLLALGGTGCQGREWRVLGRKGEWLNDLRRWRCCLCQSPGGKALAQEGTGTLAACLEDIGLPEKEKRGIRASKKKEGAVIPAFLEKSVLLLKLSMFAENEC